MNSPFFLMRLAMFFAVVAVIGLIAWLIYQDGSRHGGTSDSEDTAAERTFESTQDVIQNGTAEDLLIRVNRVSTIPTNASHIVKVGYIRDKILLFEALIERADELDGETRQMVKRGLLGSLLHLHTANLAAGVQDEHQRKEMLTTARRLVVDESSGVEKDAQIVLASVPVLEVFDQYNKAPDGIAKATGAVDDLFRLYPDDMEIATSMYTLITGFGVQKENVVAAMELLKTINANCAASSNQELREVGYGFEGRVLLVKHGVLNLRTGLDLYQGDDPDQLVANLEAFFLEDYTMSAPVSVDIAVIATRLESWNRNDEALHIYQLLEERIRDEAGYDNIRKVLKNGIQRMSAVGKDSKFPDLEPGKYTMVMFVDDSVPALDASAALARSRIVSTRVQVDMVLVSKEDDIKPLEDYLARNRIRGVKVVHDPKRESEFYQFYPAKFFPCVVFVGGDGKVIDVNLDVTQLDTFLRRFGDTQ